MQNSDRICLNGALSGPKSAKPAWPCSVTYARRQRPANFDAHGPEMEGIAASILHLDPSLMPQWQGRVRGDEDMAKQGRPVFRDVHFAARKPRRVTRGNRYLEDGATTRGGIVAFSQARRWHRGRPRTGGRGRYLGTCDSRGGTASVSGHKPLTETCIDARCNVIPVFQIFLTRAQLRAADPTVKGFCATLAGSLGDSSGSDSGGGCLGQA